MEFLHGFLVITVVHLLAAASPGPDFLMVTQQSVSLGKRAGILCSLGIALGLSVHIAYSALGLAAIIASSSTLLLSIKMLGGSYLLYLGVKGLRARPRQLDLPMECPQATVTTGKTVAMGFLCNVLNPKAPIYFVSLFTVVLSPEMAAIELFLYGIWIMVLQFAWFSLVATLFSSRQVSGRLQRYGHVLDRIFGGAMIFLGIKVLTTKTT